MRLRTEREVILTVRKKWDRQYPNSAGRHQYDWEPATREALRKLDLATCKREAVDAIIGNDSWTENHCSECARQHDTLVGVGTDEDRTGGVAAWLCRDCLRAALAMVRASPSPAAEET